MRIHVSTCLNLSEACPILQKLTSSDFHKLNRSPDNIKQYAKQGEDAESHFIICIPSKIEWDLTNGPLNKFLELVDIQVEGSIQWVLLEISWMHACMLYSIYLFLAMSLTPFILFNV